MRRVFPIIAGAILAVATFCVVPQARADALNQATKLTFNQPVALPGNVDLPTGSYWFVLLDATKMPNVIQVFNADRTQLITTFMAIPTIRMNTVDNTRLTFAEQGSKRPIAMMDWFYPDRHTGHQFLYPSREQSRLNESPKITLTARPASESYGG